MPLLVHIAAENEARDIARCGIRATRWAPDWQGHPELDRVVWAFPVLESYTLTHSWSRELKRWGRTTLAAFTFRAADGEPAYVRHFSNAAMLVTAAEAAGIVRSAADPRGYEIMLPRRIPPCEIVRWRVLPKAIGWRYWPLAKNLPMLLCDCRCCLPRGEVRSSRYRDRVRDRMRDAGMAPLED